MHSELALYFSTRWNNS